MSGGPESETPEPGADDERATGALIAEKYRVVRAIGSGATGTVYLCEHLGLDRWVALKVLHRENEQNAEFVERFKREAKAASRLEHPNSVRVLDFGQERDGALYIVMEYIEGRDLLRVLEEDGPFSAERAVDVMSQILDALSMAHRLGIVHRDLKPENVVLRSVSIEGVDRELVTVCDFGIAQLAPIRLSGISESEFISISDVGTVVGTPGYMSPEQARAEPQDARSDIYSAGVVLFQLLTLHLPFTADTPLAVAVMHCTEPPPRPSQFGAVNPALEAICLKALSKTPEARYQSADEMRVHLQRAVGAAMIATRRHTPLRWPAPRALPAPAQSSLAPSAPSSLWPVERVALAEGSQDVAGRWRPFSLPLLGVGLALIAVVGLPMLLRKSESGVPAPSELQLPSAAVRSVPPTNQAAPASESALASAVANAEATGVSPSSTVALAKSEAMNPVAGANRVSKGTVSEGPRAGPASADAAARAARVTPAPPATANDGAGPGKPLVAPLVARGPAVRVATEKALSAAAASSNGLPVSALGASQLRASDSAKRAATVASAAPSDGETPTSVPSPVPAAPAPAAIAAQPRPVSAARTATPAPVPVPAIQNASVAIGPIATRAAVSKASVRNALNMEAITSCYRAALRSGAAPASGVTAQLDLATNMAGGIKSATLRVTGFAESLRQCIEQVARRGRVKEVDTGAAEASITLFFQPR